VKTLIYLVITALLLAALLVSLGVVFAEQADFTVCSGTAIPDSQIDGKIGPEWNDAATYQNVPINPSGTGQVWIKQDGTNLYIALQFQADSNKPWVAFQFGSSSCMSISADGALFGDSNYCPNGYADIHFNGNPGVVVDQQQDGKGAISVNGSNFVTVELKKPLNSGDTAGKDINWTVGNSYSFLIEWDSNGDGSSGGTTNHSTQTATSRTLLLSANPIPEFPSSTLLLIVLTAIISMISLAKLHRMRRPDILAC